MEKKLNEIFEIEDFLKLEHPEKYDFSSENIPVGYIEEKNEIDKYFIYRSGGKYHDLTENELLDLRKKLLIKKGFELKKNKKNNKEYIGPVIIDPDSESILLQKIYILLWNVEKIPQCKKNSIKIQGETLNSVNTTLNKYYAYSETKDEKEKRGENRITNKYVLIKYLTERSKITEKFDNKNLKEFLKIYHTIGNFMPVPVGCNAPRGIGPLHDYWDLTLLHIYNYYKHNDYKGLELIVGADNALKYKDWLDCFCDWNNFVEQNYLEAFVDKEKDNYPIEFWKGHFSKKTSVYPNEEQCIEYFENATECIKNRSKMMISELKNKKIKA